MDQASIKYTNMFHCKTLQNLPKFWFENKPSGIPGLNAELQMSPLKSTILKTAFDTRKDILLLLEKSQLKLELHSKSTDSGCLRR
jgi:hypothetical protein